MILRKLGTDMYFDKQVVLVTIQNRKEFVTLLIKIIRFLPVVNYLSTSDICVAIQF